MAYRDVFFRNIADSLERDDLPPLTPEQIEALTPEERAERVSRGRTNTVAYLRSDSPKAMSELEGALVFAVVKEWSFGEVTSETLLNVPTADVKTILDAIDLEEYVKLSPDSLPTLRTRQTANPGALPSPPRAKGCAGGQDTRVPAAAVVEPGA